MTCASGTGDSVHHGGVDPRFGAPARPFRLFLASFETPSALLKQVLLRQEGHPLRRETVKHFAETWLGHGSGVLN